MFEENELELAEPQVGDEELGKVELPAELKDLDPAKATPEQITALAKIARTALFQKAHFRTKLQTSLTKKPITPAPIEKPAIDNDRLTRLEQSEEKRTFGHQHTLAPEETDALFAYAAGRGMKPADALKDPFFANGLKSMRQEKQNGAATPGISNRRPTVEGKDWDKLESKDKRANFGEFLKATTGRN